MILNYLNPIDFRTDKGALWENFLISERLKLQGYYQQYTSNYFWRTVQKQEIDFIEERDGKIYAYEFKWNSRGKNKIPSSFLREYNANGQVIDLQNFREFVMKPD
jgi:predicted AAA+ superfamily ATPase